MQSAFETSHKLFVITVVAVINLAMKQFMCIKFHRKKNTSPILREINSNFKECAIFPCRIKTIVSRKFSKDQERNFRAKDWSCYRQMCLLPLMAR